MRINEMINKKAGGRIQLIDFVDLFDVRWGLPGAGS
jgi:hypothetical protein